jgi:hypothetical protein
LRIRLAYPQGGAMDPQATIEDLVRQFAYQTVVDGVLCYTTGGLSALEDAFAVLGWGDPHPVSDEEEAP